MNSVDLAVALVASVVFPVLAVYSVIRMHQIAVRASRRDRGEDRE